MEKAVDLSRDREKASTTTSTEGLVSAGGLSQTQFSPRSLSGVEMQAALKGVSSSPKPAFQSCNRTSRPASSTQTPVEPTDEELVQAAGDMEEYEQAGPSTALLPQRVSPAGPGETTDEELLEAMQEQGALLQPRDPPEPPSMQETPSRRDPSPPPAELLPQSWRAALTAEQQEWISWTLFIRDHLGRPRLNTDLNLWWFPPQPQPVYHQPPASPEPFFACRLFLWMPHRIWRLQLTCPQPSCTGSMAKAGLYRTIRRVLDIDGWYLMATEYLECRQCKKKVAGWSQGIIRQLPPTYSCQFPAVLTYKLSCDQRVVGQLKSRTLGNSATRLYNTLREQHSDAWMRKAIHYLGVCEQFQALCSSARFAPPPPMPAVPSPAWLLTVYGYEVALRLEEYKARITSTFGSILKMDSTKKVTKKLAGAAANTAASVTSVGNEHGQVLMSILTCSEGFEGLSAMAAGLMRRYRDAEVPPPLVRYVNWDCCSRDGVSKTAALFHEWGNLVVRLDIWHYMRRITCGVTTESHELYPTFMRQLSLCIFEVDPEDARRLKEGKRSKLGREHGMFDLSDAEVIQRISKEEWRLHCRRRTRGAEQTAILIQNLLDTFRGPAGRNTLNIPLLDDLRIQDIWKTQMRHLSCIQDPPGLQLYTQTGTLTKGGVSLPVYRCARGATSLQSFHLHLNRFIPGTSASARYFQAFLVDGVVRWNEDRAAAAAPARAAEVDASLLSYSGHLKHALNQKCKRVLGHELVEDFTKPAAYTGELIGVEYLFQQTGSVFEEISDNPDPPDETAAISIVEREDEGIQVEEEDPTIFPPNSPSSSSTAASQSGAPGSEPHPSSPGSQAPSPPPQESHSDSTTKDRPLLPSKEMPLVPVGQRQPFDSELPEEQPGPSSGSLPPAPPPPPGSSAPLPLAPSWPVSGPVLPNLAPTPSATPSPPPPPRLPRSTFYRRRKLAEAGEGPQRKNKGYLCSKCGQQRRLDTGHTRVAGVSYCATFGGKSVEEWKKELQK